ncbi:MAG TPA: hypothetical protein VIL95_07080, partial [Bacillota bacterium]
MFERLSRVLGGALLVAGAVLLIGVIVARQLPWVGPVGQLAVVLATAAAVAVSYLHVDFARRMAHHFAETREGQFRPYVRADWLPSDKGGGAAAIRVWAAGSGMARAVRIDIQPAGLRTPEGICLAQLPLLTHGLEQLAPGAGVRIPIDPKSVPGGRHDPGHSAVSRLLRDRSRLLRNVPAATRRGSGDRGRTELSPWT